MEAKFLEEKKEQIEKSLNTFLPKQIDNNWLIKNIEQNNFNIELFQKILNPIWNLLERGGKRMRPALMLLCYEACGGTKNIDEFIPLVEIIHNGSLMVDDVEDSSEKRRGLPCTHLLYGVDVAINCGNLMYYLPTNIIKNSNISKDKKLKIYELVSEELNKLHFGQGMDILWHKGEVKKVSEKEYLLMCAYKTGTLARMSAKLGAILADADDQTIDALGKFAESIGIAFQIKDDILNISNTEWGKAFGDDITEGKRTLMVIRALEIGAKKDNDRLIEILSLKTRDQKFITEAVDILKKYDTISYSKKIAEEIVLTSLNKLDKLLEESKEKEELRQFAHFVIDRKI
ncbi:MAG: polyprenyl synthetase family protein [Candidatus Woesearchaeota archaeon]|jgi:geranylgeranyl pyrophosphate synthase